MTLIMWSLPVSVVAGVLIIWDRMFGTFEPEADKVYYGLIHQPKTWNPIWAQFHSLVSILKRIHRRKGVVDKLKFLFYSPSWTPGCGRMGHVFTKPFPPVSGCIIITFSHNLHLFIYYRFPPTWSHGLASLHHGGWMCIVWSTSV